ncbi:MAG: hypothetical protein KatS3mg084_0021 [Candidatus Dojkabacteria bacterium]|nr:MAG: hypothetical protein KatS3mg084_0021 [Candidatus Dojkabacteria bacterium]
MYRREVQSYIFIRNKLVEHKKIGPIKIVVGLTGFLAIITVLVHLFVMSEYATKGDEIAILQARKEELMKENLMLQEQIAAANNLDILRKKAEESGYVALNQDQLRYIKID